MDMTQPQQILQRWHVIQHELPPELAEEFGGLTPKLEKVIHTLEWVRIEEFKGTSWCGVGRPPFERAWLANAFVAKAVLGLPTTAGLRERLMIDRALRRICGFPLCRKLPSEAAFSRAFDEFAEAGLSQRVYEALIKEHPGDQLIGHLSRDGTPIKANALVSDESLGSGSDPYVFILSKSLTISELHGHGRNMHRPVAGIPTWNTPSDGVNYTEVGVH